MDYVNKRPTTKTKQANNTNNNTTCNSAQVPELLPCVTGEVSPQAVRNDVHVLRPSVGYVLKTHRMLNMSALAESVFDWMKSRTS